MPWWNLLFYFTIRWWKKLLFPFCTSKWMIRFCFKVMTCLCILFESITTAYMCWFTVMLYFQSKVLPSQHFGQMWHGWEYHLWNFFENDLLEPSNCDMRTSVWFLLMVHLSNTTYIRIWSLGSFGKRWVFIGSLFVLSIWEKKQSFNRWWFICTTFSGGGRQDALKGLHWSFKFLLSSLN